MHKLTLRARDWPVLVLCLLLLLPGSSPARAADEFAFAVARLPLSLPVYVAEARGYFREEGLVVRVVDCDTGRECLARMLAGEAQVATAADSAIVFSSLHGQRFAVLATMATARKYHKIITRSDTGINAVADLAGRRVGTIVGTSAQYFLDLSLMYAQVEPERVTVVPLRLADAAAALEGGKVDALAIFEPHAYQAVQLLGRRSIVLSGAFFWRESWNLVAADGISQNRMATLVRLCRALARAEDFIAENPPMARSILRGSLALDKQTIDWVWPDLVFRLQLSQSLISSLEGQARWAMRSGYAPGPAPNFLDYIRPEILSDAVPGAAAIPR